ncbi:hypothetical protein AB0M39_41465 [Streptomyces sp. NPDC051907]|uniref:hypothetical protein n=1 Tax=Streptomyces sp. NPDC051907 TaxID=3155284 RepID=UPI003429765B
MKLTGAQQRAYDAMQAAPDGKISSGSAGGHKRTTAEALARRGLADVTKKMAEKTVRHRNGTTSRRVVVEWTAQLRPPMPDSEEIAELDLIVERREKTLRPSQREHAAAYVAVVGPSVALEGAPLKSPDYSPAAAYAEHLKADTNHLLTAYTLVRHLTGEVALPYDDPRESIGEPTNFWTIAEPGTPEAPGKELGRVEGATQNAAAIAANSLLNRRGRYDMRRLGSKELGAWRKDFRAAGRVLRLADDGEGAFRVNDVDSGVLVIVGATAFEAERDAVAEVSSLTAALRN